MYEANFEFPYREPLECNFETNQPHLQADLIINAVINDRHFVYEQATASDVWVINHNLNKKPSITVVDSADAVIVGGYEYNNLNTVTLYFNAAFVGKAYLN